MQCQKILFWRPCPGGWWQFWLPPSACITDPGAELLVLNMNRSAVCLQLWLLAMPSLCTHCTNQKVATTWTQATWWGLNSCCVILRFSQFSFPPIKQKWRGLDTELKRAIMWCVSVNKLYLRSKIVGPSRCLDNKNLKAVVTDERLIKVLLAYVRSCTKIFLSHWSSTIW